MDKQEQEFCTKLGTWLKKTTPFQSMLIECKVHGTSKFAVSGIRKSQQASLRRVLQGISLVHKISDKGPGSKLVDMIYISPTNTPIKPMVAIKMRNHSYLVPFAHIEANELTHLEERSLQEYKIW